MPDVKTAPYGAWTSPISADRIATGGVRLGEVHLDGDATYWIEGRPTEGGRNAIVRRAADGEITNVIGPDYNARTRVHEYGGGAFAVGRGTVYFSNFTDQKLYAVEPGAEPRQVTKTEGIRYADGVVDDLRDLMFCVIEDHTAGGEPRNAIASVNLETGEVTRLVSGEDFYSSPRLNAAGTRLAWMSWNHPNMPWDRAELCVAAVTPEGRLGPARKIAGGRGESIFQPEWSPDGILYFVSDRTGWWNLYDYCDGQVNPVCEMEAEFGRPQWVFGMSTYAFASAERIICAYNRKGIWKLGSIDTWMRKLEAIESPYTTVSQLRSAKGRAVFIGGTPRRHAAVVEYQIRRDRFEALKYASDETVDPAYVSFPEAIEFPTQDGRTAYAFYYTPKNRDCAGPESERPPLLVKSHGGPTAASANALDLSVQYWTSRGIAVVDVNYGGSSGFGREYRERLKGQWGIVDVDDCTFAAEHLASRGRVDGERLAIRGASAGGYTTLAALTFRDTFKAGASHFGISDLATMAADTHKFESRYLDGLIGPWPKEEDLYRERSPIHFTEKLSCPLIFFQGLEDKVVPPDQAERMVEALREKGLPVAYVPFEGEQHGFRRAENIKRALEAELYFYAKIFGFEPAGEIEPVEIENLAG